MRIFDKCRSARADPSLIELVGRWVLVKADPKLELDPGAVAEFSADGRLTYTIPGASKDSVMLLTYRVDGDDLITDQPSAPRGERTGFRLAGDSLVLDYAGAIAEFTRAGR